MKRIKNFFNNPLFSGSFIMIFGSNAVSFFNYLYHLIMGRMLGPANYGELASLISLIGLLSVIPASVSLVIIKYISSAKNQKEINNLVGWLKTKILKASLVFFIVTLIFSPLISSFLKISKPHYLILIAASFLFSFQSGFYRSILQGLLKFKEMVFSMLVENMSKLVISILLVYVGFEVGGAMWAFVISTFLGLNLTLLYIRNLGRNISNDSLNIKPMLIFAVPVLIQSFSITSFYSSDLILVKHFFPSETAGIYAALSTLGKIIFFAAGPIGGVMFPLISKRKSRGQSYRKVFVYSFLATAFFAVSISLIYWLRPTLAINLLYGSAYLKAADLLVWFGIFISLFTLSSLLISYELSLGRTKVVIMPLLAAILQISLIWFLHQSLLMVVFISTALAALLLASLLIYSTYEARISLRNKVDLGHSSGL